MLTFEQIKDLIDLVAGHELHGIELERSGFRLKVEGKKAPEVAAAVTVAAPVAPSAGVAAAVAPPPPAAVALPPAAAPAPAATAEPAAAADRELPPEAHVLHSPIIGTFYASPSPDAASFVKAGDRVSKGQVLCIVEAMKLMNEIESDVDGEVLEIFPKNQQPVEFGEPLFAFKVD